MNTWLRIGKNILRKQGDKLKLFMLHRGYYYSNSKEEYKKISRMDVNHVENTMYKSYSMSEDNVLRSEIFNVTLQELLNRGESISIKQIVEKSFINKRRREKWEKYQEHVSKQKIIF